jgi:site-specific recombinase XerD
MRAETTSIRYKQAVEGFIKYLGDRANRPLAAITDRDIQGFITWRSGQGAGPSTLNVDGKILRAAFTRACKSNLLSSSQIGHCEYR